MLDHIFKCSAAVVFQSLWKQCDRAVVTDGSAIRVGETKEDGLLFRGFLCHCYFFCPQLLKMCVAYCKLQMEILVLTNG